MTFLGGDYSTQNVGKRIGLRSVGYSADGKHVFECKVCGESLEAESESRQEYPSDWTEGRSYATFKDYLREELTWSVFCDKLNVNSAALRAGVDFKTAKRWVAWGEENLDVSDMCARWPRSSVRHARLVRQMFQFANYPRDFSDPEDQAHVHISAAGELLFNLQDAKVVSHQEALETLKRVRKRPSPFGVRNQVVGELYERWSIHQERTAIEAEAKNEAERRANPMGIKHFKP